MITIIRSYMYVNCDTSFTAPPVPMQHRKRASKQLLFESHTSYSDYIITFFRRTATPLARDGAREYILNVDRIAVWRFSHVIF